MRTLVDEYNIHPLVAEELFSPSIKPKVDVYEHFTYLILHFPAAKHTYSTDSNQEVDFVIGKDFLITAHYDTIDPIHKFSKEFESQAITSSGNIGTHAGHIFYAVMRKLYKALGHELEYVESILNEIETQIFEGREKEMVKELSENARVLLDFKQAIAPHNQVLSSLEMATKDFFGKEYQYPMKNIIAEYERVRTMIQRQRETLTELRETNNSLLSTKQNEVMKTLTIMAFVTFPLSLIGTLFGMNTVNIPIVGVANDFWIVILLMALLTLVFFIYFKHKKWLN